jgi:chaperone BCS1
LISSRCISLLEDIDAAFNQRVKGNTTSANNITFSGLLNAIDGVAAQEGRILCMTTK